MSAYLEYKINRDTRYVKVGWEDASPGDLLELRGKGLFGREKVEIMNVTQVYDDGEVFAERGRMGTFASSWPEGTLIKIHRR